MTLKTVALYFCVCFPITKKRPSSSASHTFFMLYFHLDRTLLQGSLALILCLWCLSPREQHVTALAPADSALHLILHTAKECSREEAIHMENTKTTLFSQESFQKKEPFPQHKSSNKNSATASPSHFLWLQQG